MKNERFDGRLNCIVFCYCLSFIDIDSAVTPQHPQSVQQTTTSSQNQPFFGTLNEQFDQQSKQHKLQRKQSQNSNNKQQTKQQQTVSIIPLKDGCKERFKYKQKTSKK